VISRMCDIVMIRTFDQEIIERFPRIRAYRSSTDSPTSTTPARCWPTSTLHRAARPDQGETVAWTVIEQRCNTWLPSGGRVRFQRARLAPAGYEVEPERAGIYDDSHYESSPTRCGCAQRQTRHTDRVTSHGLRVRERRRKRDFEDWQVDSE